MYDSLSAGKSTLIRMSGIDCVRLAEPSPYGNGLAFGRLLVQSSHPMIDLLQKPVMRAILDLLHSISLKYLRKIRVPQAYLQELKGYSDSTGIAYRHLRLLNFSMDLTKKAGLYCTTFSFFGERSTWLGRNTDFPPFWCWFLLRYCQPIMVRMEGPSGIPYNHVSFPLFVGVLNGFNDRGIACNAHQLLHSRDKIGNYNVATPLLPRIVLEQAGSLKDARKIVSSHLPCRSLNLMVTSEGEGKSVVFELNPETSAAISHAGPFMVCTTHFRSPELARFHNGDIRLSQKRLKLVESRLKSEKHLTMNDCRILLSDSSNGLRYTHSSPSICNRGTFQSFVFDLSQESVWVSDGAKAPVPLTGIFRKLELRKIFTLPDAVNF